MPEGATGRFTRPEDFQESLRTPISQFIVTQSGAFAAKLTWARLPHVYLADAQETLARVGYLSGAADIVVSFSTRPGVGLFWNGTLVDPGDIVCHGSGECAHQRVSGPTRWGLVSISPAFFARYGAALVGRALVTTSTSGVIRPKLGDLQQLLGLHARVIHLVETKPLMIGYPEVGRALDHEILEVLVACLGACGTAVVRSADPQDLQLIKRFEDSLRLMPGQGSYAPEILNLSPADQRRLHRCCRAFLGVGAERYLRLRRLKLVRMTLLKADPGSTRVSEVARIHGFHNVAQFAAAYRLAFGEAPSATLNR